MSVCKRCGKRSRVMSDLCRECIGLPVGDLTGGQGKRIARPLIGVHGWLALLVFGFLVGFPLLGAGRINADILSAEREYPALVASPEWASFKAATWWAFLPFAALSAYVGWGLRNSRDWSAVKRARVVIWLIGPLCTLVLQWLVPAVTLPSAQDTAGEAVLPMMTSAIYATIWTAYLSNSKRVRNTYTSRAHDPALPSAV